MAKATAAEAAKTRQAIIDAALSMTLDKGYEHVTLASLAKCIGMSRSGITCHFRYKANIFEEIKGPMLKDMLKPLSFESTDAFYNSWVESIETNLPYIKSLGVVIPLWELSDSVTRRISGENVDETVNKAVGFALTYASKCKK